MSKSKVNTEKAEVEIKEALATINTKIHSLQQEKKATEVKMDALQSEHAQMLMVIVRYQADAQAAIAKQEHSRADEEEARAQRLEERLAELEKDIKKHNAYEKKTQPRSCGTSSKFDEGT